jgi:hypothetical protein
LSGLPEAWRTKKADGCPEIRVIERVKQIGFQLEIELFVDRELTPK